MRALKFAIAVMAVLIVGGIAVIGATLVQRASRSGPEPTLPGFAQAALGQPDGTAILTMTADGGRLVLHVEGGGLGQRLLIVDLASGALLGTIAMGGGR